MVPGSRRSAFCRSRLRALAPTEPPFSECLPSDFFVTPKSRSGSDDDEHQPMCMISSRNIHSPGSGADLTSR